MYVFHCEETNFLLFYSILIEFEFNWERFKPHKILRVCVSSHDTI